jgi:hypothetical protein
MPEIRSPVRLSLQLIGTLVVTAALVAPCAAQTASAVASSAPAKPVAHAAAKSHPAPLDLKAPSLNSIYSRRQLQYILTPDDNEDILSTGISVKGEKYVVSVPGGPGNQLVAIPWALVHPTQAWRIFTPLVSP